MSLSPVDLRSDTVTQPTPAMREAMARARVGDDVFDEDPTVHELQDRVAAMFGKPAALFVPSGTMANQICVRVHTQPGDELICETTSHVYVWEAGGPAVLSGVTTRTVDGDFGILRIEQLRTLIRPASEHYTRSRLVVLENTHNRGGGRVYPLDEIQAISQWARGQGLAMHLDGARIWNAHVASGIPLADWASPFDSISVCFSKGLGAPIGSAIIGSQEFVDQARRLRKLFGGHMRQVGILAAGALHALDHHIDRLADDHAHARLIADAIRETPGLRLEPSGVETNLVWFETDPAWRSASEVAGLLRERGIMVYPAGATTLRACTHLDVSRADAERTAEAIRDLHRGSSNS